MRIKIFLILTLLLLMHPTQAYATEYAVAGISATLDKLKDIEIFSPEEIEVLYRIVEAEVTKGDIEAKKNVASVILNRVHSDGFPDTISEVVFQKGQFSPVEDKRYWQVDITDETKEAVNFVLANGPTTDALYFCNLDLASRKMKNWFRNNLVYLFTDKVNHSFYK